MSEHPTEEEFLLDSLAELHRYYTAQAQPLIHRLAKIRSMRPPEPLLILQREMSAKEIEEMGQRLRGIMK